MSSSFDYAAWLEAASRSQHSCYAMGVTVPEGRILLHGAAKQILDLRAKLAEAEEHISRLTYEQTEYAECLRKTEEVGRKMRECLRDLLQMDVARQHGARVGSFVDAIHCCLAECCLAEVDGGDHG